MAQWTLEERGEKSYHEATDKGEGNSTAILGLLHLFAADTHPKTVQKCGKKEEKKKGE